MRYLQYLLIFVLSCSLLTAEETELVDPNTPELAPWVELHGISTIPGEPVQPAIESWVELGNRVEVTEKEDIKTVIFFNKDNLEVMQCMTKKGIIHMAIRLEWMGSPTKADHVHLLNRDLNAVSGGCSPP